MVMVLGIGYYMYRPSLEPGPGENVSPVQQVDVTGVKADLLSIPQAERLYLPSHERLRYSRGTTTGRIAQL